jgi:septal ring factor EnvC (AmiA/AmiB activator)
LAKQYYIKPILQSSLILALGMPFMIQAESVNVSNQVRQLQIQVSAANEKISALEEDQQEANKMIGSLQTALTTVHHEVSGLPLKYNLSARAPGAVPRTANGHGR